MILIVIQIIIIIIISVICDVSNGVVILIATSRVFDHFFILWSFFQASRNVGIKV